MVVNININGAKNSALPIISATLLDKKIYYLKNIPIISDVISQIDILKQFNVTVEINGNCLIINTLNFRIPNFINYSKNHRGSYYFIGSTFYLNQDISFILGNGCNISSTNRKVNYHLDIINMTGRNIKYENDILEITGKYVDKDISYRFENPSVGGTINGLFILSRINSKSELINYAKDPYIFDVINLLIKIGININYNNEKIIINGNRNFNNENLTFSISPDPIEAISYIIYSTIIQKNNSISSYTIGPIILEHLGLTLDLLENIGIKLIMCRYGYFFIEKKELIEFDIETDYFPGIYTDIQPFLCILSLFIQGVCKIKENVWDNRFNYVKEINKLGYDVMVDNNQIINRYRYVKINENFDISFTDLRGGFAIYLLMKKLGSKNRILNKHYVDRGYENYDENIGKIMEGKEIKIIYPTKNLSNIRIGGISRYYGEFMDERELFLLLEFCREMRIDYRIIGGGYNIYFSENYNGMIIKNEYKNVNNLTISSGFILNDFVIHCANIGYDISSLAGIPGTIGGAVYGNAGAYGLEISELIDSVRVVCGTGIKELKNEDMEMVYRSSVFKKKNLKDIILTVKFKIEKSNLTQNEIKDKISNILEIRNKKFSLENNIGSIFKNVIKNGEKIYAWQLLENFRGKIIYNIKISDNHPNIFINTNNAEFNDLQNLFEIIQNFVSIKYNITLEKEVECI